MVAVTHPSSATLIELVNTTNNLFQSLPSHQVIFDHWGPILMPLVVQKLDSESMAEWAKRGDHKKVAEIEPLLAFIRDRADSLNADGAGAVGGVLHSYSSAVFFHAMAIFEGSTGQSLHFRRRVNKIAVLPINDEENNDG